MSPLKKTSNLFRMKATKLYCVSSSQVPVWDRDYTDISGDDQVLIGHLCEGELVIAIEHSVYTLVLTRLGFGWVFHAWICEIWS